MSTSEESVRGETAKLASLGRSRNRWRVRWLMLLPLSLVLTAVLALAVSTQVALPGWTGDGDHQHSFTGDSDSVSYVVHVPPSHGNGEKLPVMMAIHGCAMTGYGWNSMRSTTQFNALADREGFIVVYPTQGLFRDAINCWESDDPRQQQRGSGDPALLAGVAKEVVETYDADPSNVHVAGASSGAGTAVILAATYPDVFATVTSVAGGEYGLDQVDPDRPELTPPSDTGRQAWAQMGARARDVPLLIIQGTDDDIVPPIVATRLRQQWMAISELVDDGQLNGSRQFETSTTNVPGVNGEHPYGHSTTQAEDGATLVESYLVDGMGHAWPGPAGEGLFTDREGPDASALAWEFANRHPMPPRAAESNDVR